MPDFTFSFIIPTRGRPASLLTLCNSIQSTTAHPEALEIVFVMDSDDPQSLAFEFRGLNIRKVEVPPGMAMGELNMAGYHAATGDYLLLLNDDIVLRTPAWDDRVLEVFRAYPDGVVLAHLNETIFREKLCTFPFLTRAVCAMAGGICPSGYLRYRIDDHVQNIFDLLALLGHRRRVFLPDVVFEHHNFVETDQGREYVPNPEIHAIDTRLFHAFLPERKRLALALMDVIDDYQRSEKRRVWETRLSTVTDSVAIRHPQHARLWPLPESGPGRPRVTVAVVSADFRSEHARKCLDLVKQHTTDYDLVLVDNNGAGGFNHAREMNRLLEFCRTDYLVLMDDDVFVDAGWLEGLVRAMGPDVGVVTPMHDDAGGAFSYAGVVMQPDESGHHTHVMTIGDGPQNIQTLCSALMLIDMTRCGNVRLDERYSKYFLDIDYGLRIWEEGFRVVCSPWTRVTHIGGGTMAQGSNRSVQLFEEQRRCYVRQWVETRRIHALRRGIWKTIPEFVRYAKLHREIDALFLEAPGGSNDAFYGRVRQVVSKLDEAPALRNYIAEQARAALANQFPRADDPSVGRASILLGVSGQPILYEAAVDGMNVVLWRDRFYALPANEGVFDSERIRRRGYSRSYEADDPGRIRDLILGRVPDDAPLSDREPSSPPQISDVTAVISAPQAAASSMRSLRTLAHRFVQALPYVGVLRPHGPRGAANLFDAEYYRATYPDVAASGMNPFLHFVTAGAYEGRNPHVLFDTRFYLRKYPDVARAGVNPLAHYLKHGAAELRQPHPLFDPVYYIEQYPDVGKSGLNPLVHYCLYGHAERRRPHPWFDPEHYLSQCPDARRAAGDALAHFLRFGGKGCRPHPLFDSEYYIRENPGVARSGMNPLVHFVLFGLPAGRLPSDTSQTAASDRRQGPSAARTGGKRQHPASFGAGR